jgi:lysophospholipase L1-like esterase
MHPFSRGGAFEVAIPPGDLLNDRMCMKLPSLSRISRRAVRTVLILLLAATWPGLAPAQNTNATALSSSELPAQLLFPTNRDLLPGKGPVSQWKPFPKLWAQRRAEFRQHREQDKGAVVFLGDSITQGWNSLAEDFPNFKVANRGIGGDVTRGVLFRLKEDVLELEPEAVVLLIGTNDIGNGGNPEDAADNIRMILAALEKSNPRMPIIVCKVMPGKKAVAHKIRKLDRLIGKMVKRDPRLTLCDTWSIYANKDGTCNQEEFPDMLHPNKLGYAKWAGALEPIIAKLDLGGKKAE